MKKILWLLILPLLFANCDEEEPSLFRVNYEEEFQIAAGLSIFNVWYFEINNIATNWDDYLTANNRSETEITSITPRSARMTAIFSGADYEFIRRISVRLYKNEIEDYQEIFYREDVPLNTGGILDLIPTLVDVDKKIMEEEMNVVIRMEFREAPPEFIETRLALEFNVR